MKGRPVNGMRMTRLRAAAIERMADGPVLVSALARELGVDRRSARRVMRAISANQ